MDEKKVKMVDGGYTTDIDMLAKLAGVDVDKNPHPNESFRERNLRLEREVKALGPALTNHEKGSLLCIKDHGGCEISNRLRGNIVKIIERLAGEVNRLSVSPMQCDGSVKQQKNCATECSCEKMSWSNGVPFHLQLASAHSAAGYPELAAQYVNKPKEPRLDYEEKLARRDALTDFFGRIELAAGIDTAGTFCESRECGGCPHAEDPIGDLPCKDYLDWLLSLRSVLSGEDVRDALANMGDSLAHLPEPERTNSGLWFETIVRVVVAAQAKVKELTSQIKAMETKAEDVSKEFLGSEEYLEGIVDEVHAVIGEFRNATTVIQKIREIFRREKYPW